jgi:hypothetical protein
MRAVDTIYVTEEADGDDAYLVTHESIYDAARSYEDDGDFGVFVYEYRLVGKKRYRVKKTVEEATA